MYNIFEQHKKLLMMCIAIFVVYIPAIFLDFALDDVFLIEKNPYLERDPWSLLKGDLWFGDESVEKSSFFRPLFIMSILMDTWLGGSAWLFHVHNIVWHIAASVTLYVLLRRWLKEQQALLGVGIFAFHPLQSEVAIWISARNDSMAAFFSFLALWLYSNPNISKTVNATLLRMGMICCALLSKESAFFLPVIVLFVASREKKRLFLEAGGAVLVVMSIRSYLDMSVHMADLSHVYLFLGSLDVFILGNSARLIVPWPLCATRPLAWDLLTTPELIFGGGALVGIVWLMRNKISGSGILIAFLVWIPTVWPTILNGMHGDRYLYMSMAGIAFAIASKIMWRRWMWSILLLWLVSIQSRIPNWENDAALWSSMYEQKPSSFSAVSYAHILYNQKKYQQAAVLYQEGYAEPIPYLAGCGPYLVSVLKVLGPKAVLEAGDWSLQRGCALSGTMGGVLSLGFASQERWKQAEQLIAISPYDPTKRMLVVEGVIALKKGSWDRFFEIRDGWSNISNFDRQCNLLQGNEMKIQYLPLRLE